MTDSLADIAHGIFRRAPERCDVRAAVGRAVSQLDLNGAADVLVVALGKAAVPMHEAAMASLSGRLPVRSMVVAPAATIRCASSPERMFLAGDHPSPTPNAAVAARALLDAARAASPRTVVLFLVSGGASAMIDAPVASEISMDDLIAFHRGLVAAGLPITQMNTLRKHVSAVKGGRLAVAASGSLRRVTLLVSDVPPGCEDSIGSGPTLPDPTTLEDCRRILGGLPASVHARIPSTIERYLCSDQAIETPKPGDAAFARATFATLLSSNDLALAAADEARKLGFAVTVDPVSSGDAMHPELDYRLAVDQLLERSAELARAHGRTCVVNAGEVAVQLSSHAGEGGRNQHAALYAAQRLADHGQRGTFLSVGSDGVDGNTDAAGAVCDETSVARARELGFDCNSALARCDAAPLLRAVGDQIVMGPTGNNLRDLRLVLTRGDAASLQK